MKILFDIGTPGQFHTFKHTIRSLMENKHEIKIACRSKEITADLLKLDGFCFDYIKHYNSFYKRAFVFPYNVYKLYKIARLFNPDLLVSFDSPYSALSSWILKKSFLSFIDTEPQKYSLFFFYLNFLVVPFADKILLPCSFNTLIKSKKIIHVNGYKELAYLHPAYFQPDLTILNKLDNFNGKKIILLRFASLDAIHDSGAAPFRNMKDRIEFVKALEPYGQIFITSEVDIPELKKYKLSIPVHSIHHLLALSTLYIGEGATMASEAAVLGIPWIFIYWKHLGYLDDQEKNYDLGYTFSDSKAALKKAIDLLQNDNLTQEWEKKRKKLLKEKVNVTQLFIDEIQNFERRIKS